MTREEAVKILKEERWYMSRYSEEYKVAYDMAIKALSAEAVQCEWKAKQGKWMVEEVENIYGKTYRLTCSECGERFTVTEAALPEEHFCRGCGADMRGGDTE